MNKIILSIIVIMFLGCADPYEPIDTTEQTESTYVDVWDGYSNYVSVTDWDKLLDSLELLPSVTKTDIDNELEKLKIKQDYDYSYYSGSSSCYTLTFSKYSSYSYDWIYYVSIKIWVDDTGKLYRDMCSYYRG